MNSPRAITVLLMLLTASGPALAQRASGDQLRKKLEQKRQERLHPKLAPDVADDGLTSPAHEAHVGKIVWSTKRIDFKKEDPSTFSDRFQATDAIYGRIYLARSLANTLVVHDGQEQKLQDGSYKIECYVDGKKHGDALNPFDSHIAKRSEQIEKWTTWRLEFRPVPADKNATQRIVVKWARLVNALSPGKHQIRCEVWRGQGKYLSKQPIATGGFTLTSAKGQRIKTGLKAPGDVYRGKDARKLKTKVVDILVKEGYAKRKSQALRVSLTSGWKGGRFRDTGQKYQIIMATVLWESRDKDGLCSYLSYTFIRTRQGKSWGALSFQGLVNGDPSGTADCP